MVCCTDDDESGESARRQGKDVSEGPRVYHYLCSFSKLLVMFASLYKHIEGDQLPELTALLVKAGKAEQDRNGMLHSAWAGTAGNLHPIQIKTSAKQEKNKPLNLRWQFKRTPLKDLDAIADAFWEVDQSLKSLMFRRGYRF